MSINIPMEAEKSVSTSGFRPQDFADFINRMYPIFGHLDKTTDEELKARQVTRPNLDAYMHMLGNKQYLNVAGRMIWFRHVYPFGTIYSFVIEHDPLRPFTRKIIDKNTKKEVEDVVYGYAHCGAIIFDGRGRVGYGEKTEDILGFKDYLEKAHTGAVGRALALMGIATQFASLDFDEGVRIVDSPQPVPVIQETRVPVVPTTQLPESVVSRLSATQAASVSSAMNTPSQPGQTPVVKKENAPIIPIQPQVQPQVQPPSSEKQKEEEFAKLLDQAITETIPLSFQTIDEAKDALQRYSGQFGPYGLKNMLSYRKEHAEFPIKKVEWTKEHYTRAYELTDEWARNVHEQWKTLTPTVEMLQDLSFYQELFGGRAINSLIQRLPYEGSIPEELNRAGIDELLKTLREHKFVLVLSSLSDPTFEYIRKAYQVDSPLDLIFNHREDQLAALQEYVRTMVVSEKIAIPADLEKEFPAKVKELFPDKVKAKVKAR